MALLAPALILLLVTGANFGTFYMIDLAIKDIAKHQVSDVVRTALPTLAAPLESGQGIDPANLSAALNDAATIGRRFDTLDDLRLVPYSVGSADASAPDDAAALAAVSRQVSTETFSRVDETGTTRQMIAVYIPIANPQGDVVAIASASVDVTVSVNTFYGGAVTLATILTIAFTVTMVALYLAFLYRRRRDIRSQERVRYLLQFDSMSDLLNRSGFIESANERLRVISEGTARVAVLYLDVDHFKQINDTMGHRAGDNLIRHIGRQISASIRSEDIAGRLGGDEFAVIARYDNDTEVTALATRLRAAAAEPVFDDGRKISATLSIGIDLDDGIPRSAAERLHRADLALYQAKTAGRGTHRLFAPDLEHEAARRQLIETSIKAGLDNGLFAVHFQPVVDAQTRRVVGCEALLRLTTASGEVIPPAEFIPVAESIGAIKQLGTWCLERAAETFAGLPGDVFVAVNLSARQFDDGDLPQIVEKVLSMTGLAPSRLELEVTESLILENSAAVHDQLSAVGALGVSLALDDFGAGHSSLGELWNFGFDKLKIDRAFVLGIDGSPDNSKARKILSVIIELGHRLDMSVTAEGIETMGQAALLTGLACDQLQGYLYAKPMPAEDLPRALLSLTGAQLAIPLPLKDAASARAAGSGRVTRLSPERIG